MNWTEILARGGVPDSPGYRATFDLMAIKRQEQQDAQAAETKEKLQFKPRANKKPRH
jgi:hypothetical protein